MYSQNTSLNNIIDKQLLRISNMGLALRQIALAITIEEAHDIANEAINKDHELSVRQ